MPIIATQALTMLADVKFYCRRCQKKSVTLACAEIFLEPDDGDIRINIFGQCGNCQHKFVDIPMFPALIEYGLSALQVADMTDDVQYHF